MQHNHSVTLREDKCVGCTDCIKRCPTEAIRVRNSKAVIIDERCIDCGNCIRVCKHGAKKAVTDPVEMMNDYKYKIAIPAPTLYAQFKKVQDAELILTYLDIMGFDDVVEVAQAAEIIADTTEEYITSNKIQLPLISSACPVIVRLIQRRFPCLINQIIPIISPMELAARYAKEKYIKRGIKEEDIGVFFISPCAAKATDIRRPKGFDKSAVNGVFSIKEVFMEVLDIAKETEKPTIKQESSQEGIVWAIKGGASSNSSLKNHIVVDGMDSVISVLEKVEDGSLTDVDYIEGLACIGGCLGGPLTVEDPFVAKNYLKKVMDNSPKKEKKKIYPDLYYSIPKIWQRGIEARPVFSLDEDMEKALIMMTDIGALYDQLPQIDCGSCGSPTCNSFAEDVIRGRAKIEDCVFMLRKHITELSIEMLELTQKVSPTQDKEKREAGNGE
ncbi:MAG: 4Fe-4S dicluster domain-containing protein [Epulopiscium sp.]|nr:4Fe-4S dicluster domain-containing protein [Candidatus Epulonipiscium sp.]